jgi:steroid delta-isomerase-like uncharacterized protein
MSVLDEMANIRSIYEAYQARSFEQAAEAFAEDAEITNVATGDSYKGREGYLQFARAWSAAFPDLRVEVLRYHSTDSWALVEYAFRGTHTGALITSGGFVPPTWAQVDIRLCDTAQLRDGRIVRLQTYFDTASMLRQMGLFPNSPLHTADRRAPLELYATEVDAAAQQRNKAIVHRFLEEVLNQRNVGAAAAVCATDVLWHGGPMGEARDLPTFQDKLRSIFRSFPDLSVDVHDVIAESDRVAVRLTMRGTQLGYFQGIAPTGRKISSSAMNTYRIADTRIVEEWWQHDLLGLMKQLNSAPPTPSS